MNESIRIFTDGGSRGNPGPAAGAYFLTDTRGKVLQGRGVFLGEATNNVAEYRGLVEALEAATQIGARQIEILSDSELMVRQILGQYKVKSEGLREYYHRCMELLAGFRSWKITHIPREKNSRADQLANQCLDRKANVTWSPSKHKVAEWGGKRIRLGVLISGGGRTLVNLQNEILAGHLPAEVAVVICSRSAVKGVDRARELGFEPAIIRRKDFETIETFSEALAEKLDEARVDLVVQAGWLCLWKIPSRFEGKVMNIHPALLPSFGGQGMWGHHVHEAVLKAGCKVSGCTVHFCNNEYDSGPIIVQRTCEVQDDDDADTLAERVFQQECVAYPEAIRLFARGQIQIVHGVVKRNLVSEAADTKH